MSEDKRNLILPAEFGTGEERKEDSSLAYYYWTFGNVYVGNCLVYEGATLKFFADGSLSWVCDLSSTDTGDEWSNEFRFGNANNDFLFGQYYLFDIHDAHIRKHWDEYRQPNADYARVFNQVRFLEARCSC